MRWGALERWYDFSNKTEDAALWEWCTENGIDFSGTRGHALLQERLQAPKSGVAFQRSFHAEGVVVIDAARLSR